MTPGNILLTSYEFQDVADGSWHKSWVSGSAINSPTKVRNIKYWQAIPAGASLPVEAQPTERWVEIVRDAVLQIHELHRCNHPPDDGSDDPCDGEDCIRCWFTHWQERATVTAPIDTLPAPPADTTAHVETATGKPAVACIKCGNTGWLTGPGHDGEACECNSPVIPDSSQAENYSQVEALRLAWGLIANIRGSEIPGRIPKDKVLRILTDAIHKHDAPAVADTTATDKESLTVQPLDTREREWRESINRCVKAADVLVSAHSKAYAKADLARNEDAMSFIAGLRDGATGVVNLITKELARWMDADTPSVTDKDLKCP